MASTKKKDRKPGRHTPPPPRRGAAEEQTPEIYVGAIEWLVRHRFTIGAVILLVTAAGIFMWWLGWSSLEADRQAWAEMPVDAEMTAAELEEVLASPDVRGTSAQPWAMARLGAAQVREGQAAGDPEMVERGIATLRRYLTENPDHMPWLRAHVERQIQAAREALAWEPDPVEHDWPRLDFILESGESFSVRLWEDNVPAHAANLVRLVEDGAYDGLELVAHTENPAALLVGGTLEQPWGDVPFRLRPELNHREAVRRAVVMARRTHPDDPVLDVEALDTAGMGFWVLMEDHEAWNDRMTVMGEVVNGWPVVEKAFEEGAVIRRATVVVRRQTVDYAERAEKVRLPRD